MSLREEQIRRYSRQILLPEVGGRGQRRLLASELQLCGLGAVGVYCALYLASAGVGKLWLSDDSLVSLGDVGLAGVYQPEDVGLCREEIVQRRLTSLNSDAVCLVGVSSSARAIYCGPASSSKHQRGIRLGLLKHQAVVQIGCLACTEALSDGEDIIDEALAMTAGSLGAYKALCELLSAESSMLEMRLSFDGGTMQYQKQHIMCSLLERR
jgi:hypothetical protein